MNDRFVAEEPVQVLKRPSGKSRRNGDSRNAVLGLYSRQFDPSHRHLPGQHNQESHGHGSARSVLDSIGSDGFDSITTVDGTFGELGMGVDQSGDVRIAFHEGRELRELDLGSDELAELGEILERIADSRPELPNDAENGGVYDDDRFGAGGEHKVELYGSGIIGVVFGADDPDPYTLLLDPPDDEDGTDDVEIVLNAIGDVLNEIPAERAAGRQKGRMTDPRRAVLSLYAREWGHRRLQTREARHLPGQHNQESHGNDHGGSAAKIVKRLRGSDGKSIHLTAEGGKLSIKIPFDVDAEEDPDRPGSGLFNNVSLDRAATQDFADELEALDELRTDYLAKAKRIFKAAMAINPDGGGDDDTDPKSKAAWDAWGKVGGDGQRVAGGELDVDGGTIVYEVRMSGSDDLDTDFLMALRPPGAGDDWDLWEVANDGPGLFMTHNQFKKLHKEIDAIAKGHAS